MKAACTLDEQQAAVDTLADPVDLTLAGGGRARVQEAQSWCICNEHRGTAVWRHAFLRGGR